MTSERPPRPVPARPAANGDRRQNLRAPAADEPGVLGLLVLTVVACLALMLVTTVVAAGEPRRHSEGPAATHAPRLGGGVGATTLRGGDGSPTRMALP